MRARSDIVVVDWNSIVWCQPACLATGSNFLPCIFAVAFQKGIEHDDQYHAKYYVASSAGA